MLDRMTLSEHADAIPLVSHTENDKEYDLKAKINTAAAAAAGWVRGWWTYDEGAHVRAGMLQYLFNSNIN